MKKILLILSLLFLSGCSLNGNNQPPENTGNIKKTHQLEQQSSGLQIENKTLKQDLSGQVADTKMLQTNVGYITNIYSNGGKNYLKIDYIENGPIGPGGSPEIINNNTRIRTFEISNTAIFEILTYNFDGGQEQKSVQRSEFKTRGNNDWKSINPNIDLPIYFGCGKTSTVTIQHDGQKIYQVTEDFRS